MSKTLSVEFPGGKKVAARVGEQMVMTDQPTTNGGEDSAPSPFDLFLASLATCGGFYAAEFCRKRNIGMEGLSMSMVCEKDPESKLYGKMTFELSLPPDFPEDQVEALKRAVNSCTVKKHILAAPEFDIRAEIAAVV